MKRKLSIFRHNLTRSNMRVARAQALLNVRGWKVAEGNFLGLMRELRDDFQDMLRRGRNEAQPTRVQPTCVITARIEAWSLLKLPRRGGMAFGRCTRRRIRDIAKSPRGGRVYDLDRIARDTHAVPVETVAVTIEKNGCPFKRLFLSPEAAKRLLAVLGTGKSVSLDFERYLESSLIWLCMKWEMVELSRASLIRILDELALFDPMASGSAVAASVKQINLDQINREAMEAALLDSQEPIPIPIPAAIAGVITQRFRSAA